MTITKKTAAGGIAALGSSTAVGVTVSELSKPYSINKELEKKVRELNNPKLEINLASEECQNSFRVKEKYDDNEYKNAVVSCSKFKTLSGIANKLGLDVLSKRNKSNSWVAWWDNNKDKVKEIVGKETIGDKVWSKKKDDSTEFGAKVVYPAGNIVVEWCEKQEFTSKTTTDDWHNFLIACTKDGKIIYGVVNEEKKYLEGIDNRKKTTDNDNKANLVFSNSRFYGGTTKTTQRNEHLGRGLWTDEVKMEWKIKAAGFEFKDGAKDQDCLEKLSKNFDNYGTNFQAAVKACAKPKDFKTRAKDLRFNIVPETAQEGYDWEFLWDFEGMSDNKLDELIKKIGEEFKKKIKEEITNPENIDTKKWSEAHSKIKAHCNEKNKSNSTDFTEQDWQKYLKACTKNKSVSKEITDKGEKAIGFWTGEYTENPASN